LKVKGEDRIIDAKVGVTGKITLHGAEAAKGEASFRVAGQWPPVRPVSRGARRGIF